VQEVIEKEDLKLDAMEGGGGWGMKKWMEKQRSWSTTYFLLLLLFSVPYSFELASSEVGEPDLAPCSALAAGIVTMLQDRT
jgi:hypothetical protein